MTTFLREIDQRSARDLPGRGEGVRRQERVVACVEQECRDPNAG